MLNSLSPELHDLIGRHVMCDNPLSAVCFARTCHTLYAALEQVRRDAPGRRMRWDHELTQRHKIKAGVFRRRKVAEIVSRPFDTNPFIGSAFKVVSYAVGPLLPACGYRSFTVDITGGALMVGVCDALARKAYGISGLQSMVLRKFTSQDYNAGVGLENFPNIPRGMRWLQKKDDTATADTARREGYAAASCSDPLSGGRVGYQGLSSKMWHRIEVIVRDGVLSFRVCYGAEGPGFEDQFVALEGLPTTPEVQLRPFVILQMRPAALAHGLPESECRFAEPFFKAL